jgi:beta-galactosidase
VVLAASISAHDTNTKLSLAGPGWMFTFDKVRGYLVDWEFNSEHLVELDPNTRSALTYNFWRAPTDNDRPGDTKTPNSLPYWKHFGVDALTSQLRGFSAEKHAETGGFFVTTDSYLSPPVLGWGYNVHTVYTISASGSLSVKVQVKPVGPVPTSIPRLGLDLRLPKHLSQAKWFGLGPGESYPDKRLAQAIGIWSKTVDELEIPYDVPQENGNRMETRWLKLANPYGVGIKATMPSGTKLFSWTAGRHNPKAIERALHPCDLVPEEATLLNLSSKVAGVGSAACGPGVRDDLQVKVQDDEFEFLLEAIV